MRKGEGRVGREEGAGSLFFTQLLLHATTEHVEFTKCWAAVGPSAWRGTAVMALTEMRGDCGFKSSPQDPETTKESESFASS